MKIYTHNFSFRCDIICPVSFAFFLCFSLPLHGIAMPNGREKQRKIAKDAGQIISRLNEKL